MSIIWSLFEFSLYFYTYLECINEHYMIALWVVTIFLYLPWTHWRSLYDCSLSRHYISIPTLNAVISIKWSLFELSLYFYTYLESIDEHYMIALWVVTIHVFSYLPWMHWRALYDHSLIFPPSCDASDRLPSPSPETTEKGQNPIIPIFQKKFSNAFSWMKLYKFWLGFHRSLLQRVQLTIFQHWFI